jgi:hypothetical protein
MLKPLPIGNATFRVTIQAAQNLTGTCRTPMFRLSPGDTLLLEKCRSNSQVAE